MRLVFTNAAWQDYLWFQENDRRLAARINSLIKGDDLVIVACRYHYGK